MDATVYWRKLKQRLKAERNETVTTCHGLKLCAAALQKWVRTEKQFNRKIELNSEARALKRKVAEWEKEMKELRTLRLNRPVTIGSGCIR